MPGENLVNILWVSDIHFFEKYNGAIIGNKLNNFIERFIQEVRSGHEKNNIHYVFLTGDIAMRGCKSDYDTLYEMLLKKLLDCFLDIENRLGFPIPTVLVIPGNHDVNWSNSSFLREFLDKIDSGTGLPEERIDFLRSNLPSFKELFNDYSSFIRSLAYDSKYSKYHRFFHLEETLSIIPYKDYVKDRLYGYIIDKKRRIVIFLLNSSWYSIGDNFNELLASQKTFEKELLESSKLLADWKDKNVGDFTIAENFFLGVDSTPPTFGPKIEQADVPGIKEMYSILNGILKIKDNISEYSKQISGLNLLASDSISDILDRYNDYTIITCMHHPLNWLNLEEQYPTTLVKDSSSYNLDLILSKSDLFLSGHEHIPFHHWKSIKIHDTIHLKAGCFLQDNQQFKIRLDGNWFSFLHVDTHKRKVEQVICRYVSNSSGSGHWDSELFHHMSFTNRKFKLTRERENDIYNLVKYEIEIKLRRYIKNLKIHGDKNVDNLKFIEDYKDICKVFSIYAEDNEQVYIYGLKQNFFSLITNDEFFQFLDSILQKNTSLIKTIRFILLDLYVDKELSILYCEAVHYRDIVRDVIFKRADMLFDNFRHEFFIRFEAKQLPNELLISYKDFSFANHIIQYWDFEMFWAY